MNFLSLVLTKPHNQCCTYSMQTKRGFSCWRHYYLVRKSHRRSSQNQVRNLSRVTTDRHEKRKQHVSSLVVLQSSFAFYRSLLIQSKIKATVTVVLSINCNLTMFSLASRRIVPSVAKATKATPAFASFRFMSSLPSTMRVSFTKCDIWHFALACKSLLNTDWMNLNQLTNIHIECVLPNPIRQQ